MQALTSDSRNYFISAALCFLIGSTATLLLSFTEVHTLITLSVFLATMIATATFVILALNNIAKIANNSYGLYLLATYILNPHNEQMPKLWLWLYKRKIPILVCYTTSDGYDLQAQKVESVEELTQMYLKIPHLDVIWNRYEK